MCDMVDIDVEPSKIRHVTLEDFLSIDLDLVETDEVKFFNYHYSDLYRKLFYSFKFKI